jgi:hypothetical protein
VGRAQRVPGGDTIRVKPDITRKIVSTAYRWERAEGADPYTFPRDGEYDIQIRLARDRNEQVEGLHEPHEMEVLLDRERVKTFTLQPSNSSTENQLLDANLKLRLSAKAGPHDLG